MAIFFRKKKKIAENCGIFFCDFRRKNSFASLALMKINLNNEFIQRFLTL